MSAHSKALSEDSVKNAVVVYLCKHGWRPTDIKTITEHGVDIVMRKQNYGRYFCIEAKGDPSKNAFSPRSGRENRVIHSLGQLLTRINPDNGYYYGLAYPASYRKTALLKLQFPSMLKKLKINLFFVGENGCVEHLTWKDLALSRNA
jgi:hypothetical protein